MDVSKYSYTGLNGSQAARLQAQRSQLTDLTTQETTGLKATTYEGISNPALVLSFQQKIAQNESYQSTISTIDTRLSVIGNCVDSLSSLSSEVSSELGTSGYQLTASGRTSEQVAASNALEAYVSPLNTDVGGAYVFAGKASDVSPVVDVETMLNGDGVRAGYKQVAAERLQADLGSDGLGRLDLSSSGSTVTLAEDGTHSFGMKLSGATSTLSNVTVSGPSGTPASLSLAVTGQPTAGQAIELTLTMPDGSTSKLTLTAKDSSSTSTITDAADGSTGTFDIGATTADTAANIQAALKTALTAKGETDLTAASAVQAANDFFDTSGGGTPMRVDGPPYDTATGLIAGTTSNTVTWYRGTNDANSSRLDAQARVEDGLSVNYGVRADENAFTSQIKQLAVISSIDVSGGTDADKALYSAVVDRTKGPLETTTGSDSLQSVAAEIAGAQSTAQSASDRMTVASNTYQSAVDDAMNADSTEVAVKLTTLQTQIEASYKASSILYKLTLTNYL
ncbi:MAG: hypothetical protein GX458_20980 [Phyllobacteriaceae bacterium]|nr:hypothetical protein [Phyllobacteriaceae bacterium]